MTEYQTAALQVLGQLTALQPQAVASLAEVFDGIQEDLQLRGKAKDRAYVSVSKALAKLRAKGLCLNPKRGSWGLTQDGIRACRQEKENLSPDPPSWTDEDEEYLHALAVQKVQCLGWYKGTSKFCPNCPLTKACRQHYLHRLRELEEEILAEEAAAAQPPEEDFDEDPFSNLWDSVIEDADRGQTPAQDLSLIPELVSSGVPVQISPMESICAKCGEIIPARSTVVWDPDTGNHHPQCWKDRT